MHMFERFKRSYGVFWLYLDSVEKVDLALKAPFLILHTCVAHDLRTLAIFGQRSSSNLELELCIISALIIHHLLLNDDDTLRMLQMT